MVKFEGVLINPLFLVMELDDGIELYIIKEPRALRVPITFTDELKQLLGVVARALVKRYRKEIKAIREQQEAEERKEEKERLERVIAALKGKIQVLESVLEITKIAGGD